MRVTESPEWKMTRGWVSRRWQNRAGRHGRLDQRVSSSSPTVGRGSVRALGGGGGGAGREAPAQLEVRARHGPRCEEMRGCTTPRCKHAFSSWLAAACPRALRRRACASAKWSVATSERRKILGPSFSWR
jgi:hypothetical protein